MDILKLFLTLFLLFPASLLGQTLHLPSQKSLVFLHVTVIDGTGAPPEPDRSVIIKNARILSISKFGSAHIPSEAQVIDATGRYLIPGLWDMHVHLTFENWEPFVRPVFFSLLLANGVTGVRDMAGNMPLLLKLRREVATGQTLGPQLVIAGRELNWLPQDQGQFAVLKPQQARHIVDQLVASRVDFIKVQDQLSRDVYFAIADEARKRHISFVGHVPYSVTALEASAAGQKSFEHLVGVPEACSPKEHELKRAEAAAMVRMDPKPRDAEPYFYSAFDTYDRQRAEKLFALLKKNNTWQVPTLVEERSSWALQADRRLTDERLRYIPEVTLSWWDTLLGGIAGGRTPDDLAAGKKFVERELELVRDMHRAGIKFLAGTDAPAQAYVFPGFGIHEELELLVQAGLTPMQALQAATRNPAQFLGLLGSLGTIENGKTADLVLLDANPLDDIRNTRTIAAVVARGRYLSRPALDHMLAEAQAAASRAH